MNLWHTKGFKWKIILSVLVFLLGLVCSTVFSVRMHQNALEARRKTAQLNATTYANYLIEDFSQAIGVTYALEQILISEDGQCKRFETVAQNLYSSVLQSIQLAPNGIVTDIYPAAGNEDGKIDLFHDESRSELCRYGRDNNVVTLQGPFSLSQGGSGIAVRNPVYLADETGQETFWGFTIVILRVPEVFARSTQALEHFGYDYRLSKSTAPLGDEYEEVASSGQALTDPASYTFTLNGTNSTWKLEVMPKGGWGRTDPAIGFFCAGSLILLLMLILALALIGMREQKNVFRHLATTDPLTGLLNRKGFDEALQAYLSKHAERIRAFTEEHRTFWYEGVEHPFTLSVGYAELSAADAGRTPALLLSKADLALYEVKLRGKRGCLAYSEDLQLRVRTHLGFALQDISQHLPGAFLIYKADRVNDELLFANQEMVRFVGCTDLEDLLAFTDHSFRNLIHPDEREAVEQSIWAQQDARQDGTNDYVSFRLVKKDGTYRPVLDHGRLIHNRHYGDIFYVLLMDSDFIRERYQNNT